MANIFCDPALAAGDADGTSWENAYRTYADALTGSTSGDNIRVKDSIRVITSRLTLVSGVTLWGGYSSSLTGTDITSRNVSSHATIIDGNGNKRAFANATSGTFVVDGFRFTNCNETSNGGVFAGTDVDVTFRNCTADDCSADGNSTSGGAISFVPTVSHTLTVTDCSFSSCHAGDTGGAFYIYGANAIANLTRVKITGCDCDCTTSTTQGGGGIHTAYAATTLVNCEITGCDSTYDGGGIRNGAAGSVCTITNCTIANNTAGHNGGGVYRAAGTTTLANCIVYGNTAVTAGNNLSGTITATYSDIGGGYTGTGNVDADPKFRATGGNPYELNAVSGCVDSASSSATGYSVTDIANRQRYDDPTVSNTGTGTCLYADMGSYEWQGSEESFGGGAD